MRDIHTNDFLRSHGRIQVLEVYVDETKSKENESCRDRFIIRL